MVALASCISNEGISFDPVRQPIGCFGHIINLVVMAFLWGYDAEAVESKIGLLHQDDETDTARRLKLWCKQGPLGIFHTVGDWIH